MNCSLHRSLLQAPRARQYTFPRSRYSSLVFRVSIIVSFLVFLHLQHVHLIHREQLRAKYSPTILTEPDDLPWRKYGQDLGMAQEIVAHRKEWKLLATGWEGATFVYNDSVIKTFFPTQSPFRNCILGQPNKRWPTEIPMSLFFGGLSDRSEAAGNGSSPTHDTTSSFLPVRSYFMANSSLHSAPEWHFVTPLVRGGSLDNLAKKLRAQHPNKYPGEIDVTFRPAFNRLLRTLETLHSRGLCHDDIKPSNIFIKGDTHWILSDLGNVRHLSHPYHSSRLWTSDNSQLADCRANDAIRALKSYLQFIRAATGAEVFDAALLKRWETLSRLFWWIMDDASSMSAAELRIRSEVESPDQPQGKSPSQGTYQTERLTRFMGQRRALSNTVEAVLRTRISERAARWAAMTWLFGVPVGEC